ncbi:hypothetical protein AC630_18050 [Bradyrhizobium sp. AS23.2]|nr:hypothetical protein AC630_18050 [Bradyrhizobium sp. AS23.2]
MVRIAARVLVPALAIVLLDGEVAHADCTPQAASNVTADCTGDTVNQGGGAPGTSAGSNGYGTGVETGITVNVANGARVIGSNGGIDAATVTVTNNAGASITGGAYGINATGGSANVTNSGTITGNGIGIPSSGISAQFDATVTNNAGASITGGSWGINAGTNATVTNHAGASITGGFSGIATGTNATVTNNAGASITGGVVGITTITDVTVTNNAGGSITGAWYGILANGSANVTNSGSIAGTAYDGIAAGSKVTVTNNAGGSITGAWYGIIASAGGSSVFNAGTISGGTAAIQFSGRGNTLTLAPGSVTSGNVLGTGSDVFQLGGTGSATFDVSAIGPAAQYRGFGTFNKIGNSTWTLTGTSTFAGPVNVNGGTLAVNGDITSASGVTVNAGGTLGGNGTVGNTIINGGTLAPGNSIGTLAVNGSLTLTASATYLVQVSGSTSDKTIVTGTANLAGQVVVAPLTVVTQKTTYTILTSSALTGTFGSAVVGNYLARNPQLTYLGGSVLLSLDPGLLSPILPANANVNQRSVADAIDNALLAGNNLSTAFSAIFNLSGANLLAGLTQLSGESATGTQQTTFQAMDQFLGVMTDPFIAGRGTPVSAGGNPNAYAEESMAYAAKGQAARSQSERDAYALFTKAPLAKTYDPRWSVWVSGFGGSQRTDGNTAVGSNNSTSSIYGTAVGADYRLSSNTLAGFALAGGGTSFGVSGLGGGRSDLFQAGAYLRHINGPAYISAALAHGWQDITTDRTVTVAGVDRLRAEFNANAYSGRLEGGYRFVTQGVGLTPYAAGQFTTFDLPAYAEQALAGASTFALAYGAKSVTDTRSELGLRTDKSVAMQNGVLTLRGRLAWAHDFNPDRSVAATFQTLPGASFVANGAALASDSALTTASIEMKWLNGWSAAGTFEGEFSNVTRSYAGKGVVRYAW